MKNFAKCLPFLMLLFVMSCEGDLPKDGFEVSGKIGGYEKSMIYLDRYNPYGNVSLDSVQTDGEGSFSFKRANPNNEIFILRFSNNQSAFFYPMQDRLTVNSNKGEFSSAKFEGSPWTKTLFQFSSKRMQLRGDFVNASRSLQTIDREGENDRWIAQESLADAAMESYRNYVRAFVDTVSQPEIALYGAANLNVDGNFYYLQEMLKARRATSGGSEIFKFLDFNIQESSKHFLAYQAINFGGITHLGDSISLDQFKGKPVYLYIWASYCGLSRAENKRLAACRKNHPNNEIEFLCFSIDDDEGAWKKAIVEDSLNWAGQLRGKSSWQSPEIGQFGVETIPTAFLLDERGVIRSKNIHAKELDQQYDEILKRWGGEFKAINELNVSLFGHCFAFVDFLGCKLG